MGFLHIQFLILIFIGCLAAIAIVNVVDSGGPLSGNNDIFHQTWNKKKLDLLRMNTPFSVEIYFLGVLIFPFVIGILVFLGTGNGLFTALLGLCGTLIPEGIVQILYHMNDQKFDERYARSLQQMASSLKAGMSILESVSDVANSRFIHPSLRKKYAAMALDLQMGATVADAFFHFANTTKSQDAKDVAIAIDVQNEIGGHEAEVIENIANNIHSRIELRKEVKSAFAGTTSMVWMMDFIPGGVCAFYGLTNDQIMEYYSHGTGILVLIVVVACLVMGSIVNHSSLNKILKGE